MPWSIADVDAFNKGLSDAEKERWIAVANSTLADCEAEGGDDCDALAIRTANAAVSRTRDEEESMELGSVARVEVGGSWVTLQEAMCLAAEAVTLKATAKGLLRQLTAVLDRRDIPASLRKELDDVIAALKKSWSDLSGEAGNEKDEDSEESMEAGDGIGEGLSGKFRQMIREELSAMGLEPVEELAEAELTETRGQVVELLSGDGNGSGPLRMQVALIEPGMGNSKDNHLYEADMLKRDAHIFEGVKMYTTDHRKDEMSVRTEVSQILKCPAGFTETGAPVAEVGVFDPTFATAVRNREKLGILGGLHCSIRAKGKVKKAVEFGGQKVNRVEAIVAAESVDWVTQAGAGGRALSLVESSEGTEDIMTEKTANEKTKEGEAEEDEAEAQVVEATLSESNAEADAAQEDAVTRLSTTDVLEALLDCDLPRPAMKRIARLGPFADKEALAEAIRAETEYLEEVAPKARSSGPRVTGMGRTKRPEPEQDNRSLDEAEASIIDSYLSGGR